MNLTYEEVVELKNALVKAQHFSYAAKFRDEEKRLFSLMSKKRQKEISDSKNATKAAEGKEWVWASVNITLPNIKKLLLPLERIGGEITWVQTGNDPHDLYAKPKRSHMLRVERLEKGVYWWAFYIGKDSFASYDVGDYGKSLEEAKEKCELYYYLKITA